MSRFFIERPIFANVIAIITIILGVVCLYNLPVAQYVTPAEFDAYRDYGLTIGFKMVFSGPLVRSSYMADQVNEEASRAAR